LKQALDARGGEIDRYTHRFHTYPARMHPDAAAALLASLGGKRVLDPFCGGGTLLVEALVRGARTFGRDINPVAVVVATARTRLVDADECGALVRDAERIAKQAASMDRARVPPRVHALREWFAPSVMRELGALHALIPKASPLSAVHLSLVVKYSRRASDTSQRRVETRHSRGAVLRAFVARASELAAMLSELRHATPRQTPEADVALGDARRVDLTDIDLVCTSPPYPATYDYVPLQELRLAWLDAPDEQQKEIGARRSFRRSIDAGYAQWVEATRRWVNSAARALAPGGRLAILTGDGIARGRLLDARIPTADAARRAQLSVLATCSIERVDPATGLAKREHALVFEKAISA